MDYGFFSGWVAGIATIFLIVFILSGIDALTKNHDKEVAKSADQFTICTYKNYHMSPTDFIERYGVNEECK